MNQDLDVTGGFDLILAKIDAWINGLIVLVPNLVAATVLLLVFYAIARSLEYVLARTLRRRGRPSLANVGGALLRWGLMILGFLLAATIVLPSLRPGDLFAGLGIGSVAIGFAFKDILQNLLSGVLILLRQPFKVGDQILVDGFEGTVEDIETRATYIKTYDGRRVIIPNSKIYTGSFTVNTAFELRRSEYDIGIGSGDDWEHAMDVLVKAMQGCEGVLSDPAPEAIAVGIDAYQNTIRLRWWTNSVRTDVIHAQGHVLLAAFKALKAEGIDMPYPTEVHLHHDQTEDVDGDRRRQREGWPASPDGQGDPRPRWMAVEETRRGGDGESRRDRAEAAN